MNNGGHQAGLPGFEHRDGSFLTVQGAADLYRVDVRTVYYWRDRGWVSIDAAGRIRYDDLVPGVYQAQLKIINAKGADDMQVERKELTRIRKEREALRLKSERAELIDAYEVQCQAYESARNVRSQLDRIPARIAGILASCGSDETRIIAVLNDELRHVHGLPEGVPRRSPCCDGAVGPVQWACEVCGGEVQVEPGEPWKVTSTLVSKCCQRPMRIAGTDEGTHSYQCVECGQPCGFMSRYDPEVNSPQGFVSACHGSRVTVEKGPQFRCTKCGELCRPVSTAPPPPMFGDRE